MDNLAHSITSVTVGSALFPEQSTINKKRLYICSILIGNLPDIDFVLAAFGKEFYFYHHRGLTHSLLGLTLIIPLSLYVFNRIMGPACHKNPKLKFSFAERLSFVTVQLFVHFLLDYLTTYGMPLLYPFSWMRFSYPLMFVIDPLYWAISGAGAIALFNAKLKSARHYALLARLSIVLILCLWLWENYAKNRAEAL